MKKIQETEKTERILHIAYDMFYYIAEYAYLTHQENSIARSLEIDPRILQEAHQAGYAKDNPCAFNLFVHALHRTFYEINGILEGSLPMPPDTDRTTLINLKDRLKAAWDESVRILFGNVEWDV